jgi:hypothetical protein
MERGFEQFFIFALVLFAALVDLIVRSVRSKTRRDQRADVAGVEEAGVDEELVLLAEADTELSEEEPAEPRLPPPPLPSPGSSPPMAVRPRRRHRARRWLKHPLDARRGIVMMTILGPCRGLQPPDSDALHSH